MSTLLIAGTAPQAGKSTMAAALQAYWQIYVPKRQALTLFTPTTASNESSLESASESSPWLDLAQVWQQLGRLSGPGDLPSDLHSERTTMLELPGELGTPLTPEVTVADLAWDWRMPTVLVIPAVAGLVGQAIAHVALARQTKVHLKGLVLNCKAPDAKVSHDTVALIQSLTQVSVLGTLPHFEDVTDTAALATAASHLNLERLFPLSILLPKLSPVA